MALTLKSTGLSSKVKFVLMVDDDAAIKMWETPGSGATRTIGSGLTQTGTITVGSATTWKSSAFSPRPMAVSAASYITIDTAIAYGADDETNGFGFGVIGSALASAQSGNRGFFGLLVDGAGDRYFGIADFADWPRVLMAGVNTGSSVNGTTAIPTGTTKYSLAFTSKDNSGASGAKIWSAPESDAGTTQRDTTSAGNLSPGSTYTVKTLFSRVSGTAPAVGSYLQLVAFSSMPDETDLDAWHADPFGTLFDSTGGASVSRGLLLGVG